MLQAAQDMKLSTSVFSTCQAGPGKECIGSLVSPAPNYSISSSPTRDASSAEMTASNSPCVTGDWLFFGMEFVLLLLSYFFVGLCFVCLFVFVFSIPLPEKGRRCKCCCIPVSARHSLAQVFVRPGSQMLMLCQDQT